MAIDKRPTRVAAMFDAIAARYDLLNRLLSAGIDRRWRRRAIRSLRLTGRESVVDVCTGTADVALTAVEVQPGAARVVGVDFSGEMLRLGARKVRDRGQAARILLARGDATRLPIRSGSADAATVAFGIRNVEDPERGLAEMYRALAPGGRLAILEFSIPSSALVRAVYLPYLPVRAPAHRAPGLGAWLRLHVPAGVGRQLHPARYDAGHAGVQRLPRRPGHAAHSRDCDAVYGKEVVGQSGSVVQSQWSVFSGSRVTHCLPPNCLPSSTRQAPPDRPPPPSPPSSTLRTSRARARGRRGPWPSGAPGPRRARPSRRQARRDRTAG